MHVAVSRTSLGAAALVALALTPNAARAQTRRLSRSELGGTVDAGTPFETVCSGAMRGLAVRTDWVGGLHVGKRLTFNLAGDDSSDAPRIVSLAPICAGQDSSLTWISDRGSGEERFVIDTATRLMAVAGTVGGKKGDQLASLELFGSAGSLKRFGTLAKPNDQHPTNDLFIQSIPRNAHLVGVFGKFDKDHITRFGLVYERDAEITQAAKGEAIPATDVADAISRGLKARSNEGASSNTSRLSRDGTGYDASMRGPLNRIANEARSHGRSKQTFTPDSITDAEPVIVLELRPWDASNYGPITFTTGAPNAIELVYTKDGAEQVVHPVTSDLAFFSTGHDNDANFGGNNFVGTGARAVFNAADIPPGEFTIRVTAKRTYTLKFDAKERAKIR